MASALGAFLLKPWSLQPVSRSLRAKVTLWGARAELALFGLVAAVLMTGLAIAPIPSLPIALDAAPIPWPLFLGTALAWAPVAQWAPVRWGPMGVGSMPRPASWATVVIFLLVTIVSALPLSRVDPLLQAACICAVAVTAQILFGVAVRRHYARSDLLPARGSPGPGGAFLS
jgi:hypothetical protein